MSQAADLWNRLPLGKGVSLLAHDANGLAALNKPQGVLSHPNQPSDERRSILTCPYDIERESFLWKGGELHLINRLDSATSGVILVASSLEVAKAARAEFAASRAQKTYLALVFGRPRLRHETWTDRLQIQKGANRVRTLPGDEGASAETEMECLAEFPGQPPIALIALHPLTGRSHQLRVQCQRRKLPIVGDANYGDFAKNKLVASRDGLRRLCLHSLRTQLEYRFNGKRHAFEAEAPAPPEFSGG